jgi:large subunit ribosomal protein L3
MGSSGGGQGSGSRVHPGKNMAGRMGAELNTIQNLKILQVDEENGIVVVSGRIPRSKTSDIRLADHCDLGPVSGPKGCTVKISDAKKKPWPDAPLPAEMAVPEPSQATEAATP